MESPPTTRIAWFALALTAVVACFAWSSRVDEGEAAKQSARAERAATLEAAPALDRRSEPFPSAEAQLESVRSEAEIEPPPSWSATPTSDPVRDQPPTVEVHVWRDGAPAARVRVRAEIEQQLSEESPAEQRVLESFTDGAGRCVFDAEGFVRGVAFIGAPGETEVRCDMPKPDQMRHPRVYVSLGSATVFGVAYGETGEPIEGAQVRLKSEYHRWEAVARSGAGGLYEITGVPSGQAVVTLGSEPESVLGGSVRIELGARESRRVDLGGAEGSVLWTGRATAVGDAEPAELLEMWAFPEDGYTKPFKIAVVEGRFEVRVMPGKYAITRIQTVRIPAAGSQWVSITIGAQDTELDVELPPALAGRVIQLDANGRVVR